MNRIVFLIIFIVFSNFLFSQNYENSLVYNVGFGPGIEGNMGLYGFSVEQELDFHLKKRLMLSGSLNFFQTLGNIENGGWVYDVSKFDVSHHTGLFTNLEAAFLIISKEKVKIGATFGPSFQIGGGSYYTGFLYDFENDHFTHYYENFQHRRLGYSTGIMASWAHKNPNRQSSIKLRMYSFEGYYGYFLMTGYRLGFKIK
jgi:hypothetical protein